MQLNIYAGKFLQVFEEEALTWEEKLNRINALFDVWIDVQRRWVYLEGIFSGSVDIKALLPVETSRFQNIRLVIGAICSLVTSARGRKKVPKYRSFLRYGIFWTSGLGV